MFKSAAAKLAHNSTLPALAGNRDIRPLQDLITSEKAVLQSFQKLSHDLTKANDCLRHWGSGEGDDLQDVLNASTTLLGHLSSAFMQMASHEASIREHMKALRTKEESLDELRRRRKAVVAKADTAEKRLSKMNPENKNIQQQTELLNNLRDQIKNLDFEILSEEAKIGDFKRSSTKNWMTLKFGGLLECAEKATIVAEMGKLVIEEIPLDLTEPGQSRKFYTGHEKTEKYVTEAQRCVSEVVFDPQLAAPAEGTRPFRRSSSIDGLPAGGNTNSSSYIQSSIAPGPTPMADEFGNLGDHRASRSFGTMPMPMTMPSGPMRVGDDDTRIGSTIDEGGSSNLSSGIYTSASQPASRFGGVSGGQFATFPARKSSLSNTGLSSPPPPHNQGLNVQPLDEGNSSFAAEVADALAYAERDDQQQGKTSFDGPAPSYQTHEWSPSFTSNRLPRGAAPPSIEPNPWDGAPPAPSPPPPFPPIHVEQPNVTGSSQSPPSRHIREAETTEDGGETQLPYASPPPMEHQLPPVPGELQSRHVHFGGAQSGLEAVEHEHVNQTQENIPPPPPLTDEEANKAAAREVAREMDMLTFSPPPGPPPGHVDNRSPSPLQPPAPPFAQQQRISPPPDFGATLSPRPGSSHSEVRDPPVTSNIEAPSPQLAASNIPPSNPGHQTRPSMAVNVQSPSPAYSFSSTNASTYVTPPEMPAVQPLRTGSPASLSMAAPGTRTISAAAFKRPGIRSPSGSQSPSDTRSLPDVTPLALRKKRSGGGPSLPSSPYPGPRDASLSLQQGSGQSQENQAMDDPRGPAPDYESSYDVISSYSEHPGTAPQQIPGGGYEQGKFATNLDGDGLR